MLVSQIPFSFYKVWYSVQLDFCVTEDASLATVLSSAKVTVLYFIFFSRPGNSCHFYLVTTFLPANMKYIVLSKYIL